MSGAMDAQSFLLAREYVRWRTDRGRIYWAPQEALDLPELATVRDLKPELIALLGFTAEQRTTIFRLDPQVDLKGLARYREGLDLWDQFTRQDQTMLQCHAWSLEDLRHLYSLTVGMGGSVEAVWPEDPTSSLPPPSSLTAVEPNTRPHKKRLAPTSRVDLIQNTPGGV